MKKIRELLNSIPILERWSRKRKVGRLKRQYERWQRAGASLPMPHYGKQLIVAEYRQRFHTPVLIETVTYNGHMVMAMLEHFREIYSIELDTTLCENANRLFAGHPHVHILQGSSDIILPLVLSKIDQPCLFWLDAHFSGGKTAKANLSTPIMQELMSILEHPYSKQHVLLIDDARCFNGEDDYPTLIQVQDLIYGKYPDWCIEVKDDVIRVHDPRIVKIN